MSKPTPGPYTIHEFREGVSIRGKVDGKDISIATFWDGDIFGDSDIDRAKANARAWVEGRDAQKKLEKIQVILRSCGADMMNPHVAVVAIGRIITEAKT